MEGIGGSSHGSERRAARLLLNIDLNLMPKPEPEEQQQLPQNDAPQQVLNPNPHPPASPGIWKVIDLDAETPEVDVLVNTKKVARVGTKTRGDVDSKSHAGAWKELTGPAKKRPKTLIITDQAKDRTSNPGGDAAASSNEKCVPPKIKWKAPDMVGDVQAKRSSPEEEQKKKNP